MLVDVTSGIHSWWGPALAFAAGVVSFASPCVLPLVPGYLSFVTGGVGPREPPPDPGRSAGGTAVQVRRRPVYPILLFVLGFTVVFTVVGGFGASLFSTWLRSPTGQRVAGLVVIAFGLFMLMYALRLGVPWMYREERPFLSKVKPGPAEAFPLGMAFAVGWTPCIGPALGAILTLAGGQGTQLRAVVLLLAYSLGLGLPFVLLGLGISRTMGAFRFFTRNYQWIAGVSGAIMVGIGVLLVTGAWTRLTAPLFRFINRFTPAL